MVVGGDLSAPNFAQFAALLRKAHDENQSLLATGIGKNDFGVVQRFGFDGWDGLRRGESGGETEEREELEQFHRAALDGRS